MIALGIHDGHNASAAVMNDGRVIAAVQEERLSGVKNHHRCPVLSIQEVMREAGIGWGDVDRVALHSRHMPYPRSRDELLEHYRKVGQFSGRLRGWLRATPANLVFRRMRHDRRLQDLRRAGVPLEKLEVVEHHSAHAAAAYFGAPWRDVPVLVLTCDGAGDDLCATVSVGQGTVLRRLYTIPEAESLGNVFALVTFLLGMVPNEHEYKLMGMAPYAPEEGVAKSRAVFEQMVAIASDGSPSWRRRPGVPPTYYALEWLKRRLEFHRFDWICGAVQEWLESLLVEWVQRAIRVTKLRRVALGGGVFMNVKVNQRILQLPEVEGLFVFPSCGDESNAIGAAYSITAEEFRRSGRDAGVIPALRDVYWGPDVTEPEVRSVISTLGGDCRVEQPADIEMAVAKLLSDGEVVARCKGRLEFGARALGNRSILADPGRSEVVRTINDMIKNRDFWMPFASSMLAERQHEYIQNPKCVSSPYMILAFPSTSKIDQFRAGAHPYDLSVRPQTVEENWNPQYHRLIRLFGELTGKGVILNTSLNLHGYPMARGAKEAVDVFIRSGLRFLALGSYLLAKNGGGPEDEDR